MCGIFGFIVKNNAVDKVEIESRVDMAYKSLRHRGPDDEGCQVYTAGKERDYNLVLGHTRLAILDLTRAGHQPMNSLDNRYVIVFNGEIYNYKEIRSELLLLGYEFHSNTDTEVLLNAWAAWGLGCLPRLVGMFSFAVFDAISETVTCVRDAFGIKPFYYAVDDGFFVFASEISAVVTQLREGPSLNLQQCYDYLVHGSYDATDDTFFNGIKQLKPGCYFEFNSKSGEILKIDKWWKPKIQENLYLSFDDAVLKVREIFLKNISLHLRSDVAVGAALSGGIDSSAIVCAMRYLDPNMKINTFSYIADGADLSEEYWVDLVNKYVGAIPHKVRVNSDELLSDLDDLIRAQGEPFGSTSVYAQYRVNKKAHENGVVVTLEGQGADEMLAGYNGYPGQRLLSLLENYKLLNAWNFIKNWSRFPGRSKLIAVKYLISVVVDGLCYEILLALEGRSSYPKWLNAEVLRKNGVKLMKNRIRPDYISKGRRVISELCLSLYGRGLNTLLRHGDRNSMAFGVESRVPFLTNEFALYLLSLPESYLISDAGQTKSVFREAMRGIVPDEILDRRDKVGFETVERDLIIKLSPVCRDWLANCNLDFINQSELLKEFDDFIAGKRDDTRKIWRWINFIRWKMLCYE